VARTLRVGVMTYPLVADLIDMMRMRDAYAVVDSFKACLNKKTWKGYQREPIFPWVETFELIKSAF